MNYKRLIISLVLPQLAGLAGAIFTAPAIPHWYAGLVKPSFSPPNWLFGPAWLALYLLMGLSVYLIWQKSEENKRAKVAGRIFWAHLFFNALWSPLFFGLQNPILGLLDIILIWIFIIILIIKFYKIDRRASFLLMPYLAWVSFATALNYFVWRLN